MLGCLGSHHINHWATVVCMTQHKYVGSKPSQMLCAIMTI